MTPIQSSKFRSDGIEKACSSEEKALSSLADTREGVLGKGLSVCIRKRLATFYHFMRALSIRAGARLENSPTRVTTGFGLI